MIIFDTETTDLVKPSLGNLDNQPKIIELYAMKVDDETLEKTDELEELINPREQITDEIAGITGITNDMVVDKPPFVKVAKSIAEFWLGEKADCGHNIAFDLSMLRVELTRLGLEYSFPWAMTHFCTVELSEHYLGRRLKLIDLHEHLLGERFESAHRARADVEATHRVLKEIKRRGDLPQF